MNLVIQKIIQENKIRLQDDSKESNNKTIPWIEKLLKTPL